MTNRFINKYFPAGIPYSTFIFIPLFISVSLIFLFFSNSNLTLFHFTNRSVSAASAEGLDIALRVKIFYRAIFCFIFLMLLFTALFAKVRELIQKSDLLLINGLSAAAFTLFFFKLTGAEMNSSLYLMCSLMFVAVVGTIARKIMSGTNDQSLFIFAWCIAISFCVHVLLYHVITTLGYTNSFTLPVTIAVCGSLLYSYYSFGSRFNERVFRNSKPLIFIPLFSFLSLEGAMIFNQHEKFISSWIIFIPLVIIAFVVGLKRKQSPKSLQNQFYSNWVSWILAGLSCLAYYKPVIAVDIELFEHANRILPLQQWFDFGKVPLLDTFPSHAVSDFGLGWLYSFFNGADPLGGFAYWFLVIVIFVVISYLFMYRITGDGLLSLWFILLFPYADYLLPSYYNFVPLAAIVLIAVYQKQTIARYALFFGVLSLMTLWRIDLGSSVIVAAVITFLFVWFAVKDFRVEKKKLLFGAGIICLSLIAALVLALSYSGKNLFTHLTEILHYVSSFQSYGLNELSSSKNLSYFLLYFVIPFIVIINLFYVCKKFIYADNRERHPFYLAIIFLSIFYISNLQRGLVRHTLAEGWDTAQSSYGFFIIASTLLVNIKGNTRRFFSFYVLSTAIAIIFLYGGPSLTANNRYHDLNEILKNTLTVNSHEKIKRISENPGSRHDYHALKAFFDRNLNADETFFDFSNTPMLYYYTRRRLPDYFCQPPHTAHDEFLQMQLLKNIRLNKPPFIVYSNYPENFWDNLDGIPNAARHYLISEYVFQNYYPAVIIDGHSIWVKNNREYSNPVTELKTLKLSEAETAGVILTDSVTILTTIENAFIKFKIPEVQDEKLFARTIITANNTSKLQIKFDGNKNTLNYYLKEGDNVLLIPIIQESKTAFSLIFQKNVLLTFQEIILSSSNEMPDQISVLPKEYSLRLIPYQWGTFGMMKHQNQQTLIGGFKKVNADSELRLPLADLNKKNENYVHLSLRNPEGKSTAITVNYGSSNIKTGGFNFITKNDSLFHDYILRPGTQYNWYGQTDWISFYAAGNNMEIGKFEIVRGE
jgi:hypothetical protein